MRLAWTSLCACALFCCKSARETETAGTSAQLTTAEVSNAPVALTPTPTPQDPPPDGISDAAPLQEDSDVAGDAADSNWLNLKSEPAGAKVYIDGTLVGMTPLQMQGTDDTFRLALILEGYGLHTSDIHGRGDYHIELREVTPPEGPAGIKVRCKKKHRYYVSVDDHETGQLCPTERIGVKEGEHTVEIYDPVTDARRSFVVVVEGTRLSLRVRVD